MATKANPWTFAKSTFSPPDKPGTSYITFGFYNPAERKYKSPEFPLLYAKATWRVILGIMDIKANRDKIRKEIAAQDKVTAQANVVANKAAETTGQSDVMSPAMVAQIAQIVSATLAAQNGSDED
jgi:hypothetical protein